jgi:hypothetical protein
MGRTRSTASLPQTAHLCGRESEIALQFTQYTASSSGILQVGAARFHSMTFAIAFHSFEAWLPLFFCFSLWFFEKRPVVWNTSSDSVSRRIGK